MDEYAYLGERVPFFNSPPQPKRIRIAKDSKEINQDVFFPNVKFINFLLINFLENYLNILILNFNILILIYFIYILYIID
jgi:hypothetical protein